MINFLIKFKKLKFYKFLLLYIIKPVYDLLWEYIINFKGKIYYLLWISKKKEFLDLENNDKKFIFNNHKFKILAEEINSYCFANIVEKSKKEMFSGQNFESNQTNAGERQYTQDLFPELSDNIQKKIFELAHSELLITTAAKYLKVFPILDKIIVSHNISNKPENKRGAMLWHKDDFGYRSLDLFMAINYIDEFSGPLKVLKNKNPLGIFSKNGEENKKISSKGERGKIKSDHFEKLGSEILTLKGESGTALLVDSFTVYHKGGHCIKNDRLMLRFSYQTPDSVRVYQKRKFYNEFEKLKENFSLNFFLNFLYKEKPSKFLMFFRIYLMKFYRILHIKEN
tara:strand:- start:781 stop:1800 length:1020 start_codon:yes stop_codon:yes gene_type:complete